MQLLTINTIYLKSGAGSGPHFVVEACEYDRSFLNFSPRYAAILNIEEDHLDCYADIHEITEAFAAFASLVAPDGRLVVNGADRRALQAARDASARIETFGLDAAMTWAATDLRADRGRFAFDLLHRGRWMARIQLKLAGRHHVGNALAAAALAWHCGAPIEVLARALGNFRGADRRLSERGSARGITIVDDYAHHPTEIQVTLRAARDLYRPERLWVVFQPHQHSRTRFLLEDFARSFGLADIVLVPDIYFVRDSEAERDRIHAEHLVQRIQANGGDARYLPTRQEIFDHLVMHLSPGDVVMTMGAGDIWRLADELVEWLKSEN